MDIDCWTPGVKLLSFVPERQARSFIGRLVKWHGRKRVLRAIEEAHEKQVANAQEWLVKRLASPDEDMKPWSDEWLDREVKQGRIQARPGESFSDLRRRLRSA